MPSYLYACRNGHRFQRFSTVSDHSPIAMCECGQQASQIITAPTLVKVAADVCYDSPIDGRPITSHDAWKEDLKRHDCVAYDPEMKNDAKRRIDDADAKIDALVDAHVEETIEKMPTAKRAQLYSEMTEQGMSADVVRSTPGA
jgi:hypothetical protein